MIARSPPYPLPWLRITREIAHARRIVSLGLGVSLGDQKALLCSKFFSVGEETGDECFCHRNLHSKNNAVAKTME
ncbi:hypothetical protein TNIN_58151 [Trichonephila inaurata madagascariensis]|nr:hypothetical protein TNIN_58151 [Trichonephila inaurata madagascariensis]